MLRVAQRVLLDHDLMHEGRSQGRSGPAAPAGFRATVREGTVADAPASDTELGCVPYENVEDISSRKAQVERIE